MSRRLIATYTQAAGPRSTERVARVYRCSEWGEYVVRFAEWWAVLPPASDYHTDDRADALSTARTWADDGQGLRESA